MSGHAFTYRRQRWHCTRCLAVVPSVVIRDWAERVRCRNVHRFNHRVRVESMAGQPIDRSHTLHYWKGVLFCGKCGYWAQDKPKKLRFECPGRAGRTTGGATTLRRLSQGLHPQYGRVFTMADQCAIGRQRWDLIRTTHLADTYESGSDGSERDPTLLARLKRHACDLPQARAKRVRY